jgi:diguanylate cyclase (GGDEF)-like protein/PAS domain S-box-containing protein
MLAKDSYRADEEIHELIASAEDIERRHVGVHQTWRNDAMREAKWFVAVVVFGYILFVLLAHVIGRRELRFRRSVERQLRESEARTRTISDHMPALITYVDRDERYRFCNSYLAIHAGAAPDALIGRTMREACPPLFYAEIEPHIRAAMRGERAHFDSEYQVRGKPRHFETHYLPDMADGVVRGFYAMSIDVTERKRIEETLYREYERLDVTMSSIGDGVITTDAAGHITYLNPVAQRMSGWSNSEAVGLPLETVFHVVNAKTRNTVSNPITKALAENRIVALEADSVLICRDGSEIAIDDSAAPIRDRTLNVVGGVLVFHDVTEARSLAARLAHQAHHDALTGLPNRLLIQDRITQAITSAARQSGQVALLFIDLNKFKPINDSLGHAAGDELLKQVASRLKGAVRASDSVARLGGDEFVVLLPMVEDTVAVARIADKMRQAIAAPFMLNGSRVSMGASIGISMYPNDGKTAETLLKNADAAMYEVKLQNNSTMRFFRPHMNDRATLRFKREVELRSAIAQQRFELLYQPKIHFPSGKIVGAEALVRMRGEDGTLVAPAEFIGVAEEIGVIGEIGRWVLEHGCRQLSVWADASITLPLSVNVSPIQLRKKSFVADVAALLKQHAISAERLELEVTENLLLDLNEELEGTMRALLDLGVRISIDDFGTGYSSLSYLNRIPAGSLKIDRSFVTDIVTKESAATVTRAVIGLARNLSLDVIAEGVETREQAETLLAQGCDIMQGFYFHPPMPTADFTALVTGDPVAGDAADIVSGEAVDIVSGFES